MIIARIETFPLRIPFRAGARNGPSPTAVAHPPAVDSLLVRVTTDDGLHGWGEAFGFEATGLASQAIADLITPLCAGQDATRIGPLMRDLQQRLQVFGRAGTVLHALSAIDTALWDIAGKAAGLPLHRLLGGSASPDLPCYASLDPYGDPGRVREAVSQATSDGFTRLKLHERQPPAIRAARDAAGPGPMLMLDVNCPWTPSQALARARELRDLELAWLEEPLWPPEDYHGLARLRAACGIPLAAGENTATLLDFDRLMAVGAIDYVQPSVAKIGGISELSRIFPLAAARGVTVMPHTFYHGPGLLAAIHVTAALGTADSLIEWRYSDLQEWPYGKELAPQGGRIPVPQGPGLGIDPDLSALRPYLRDETARPPGKPG
jgi:L-alanine-DL-glutamate epimerase-like enolase superfamily enzyme